MCNILSDSTVLFFQFLTSHKQRAKDSATVFYQSVFNRNPENELPIVKTSDDRFYVSRFYEMICNNCITILLINIRINTAVKGTGDKNTEISYVV